MPRAAALKARSSLAASLASDRELSPESRRMALAARAGADAESDSADDFAASHSGSRSAGPSDEELEDEEEQADDAASEDEEMDEASDAAGGSARRRKAATAGKGKGQGKAQSKGQGKRRAAQAEAEAGDADRLRLNRTQGAAASQGAPFLTGEGAFEYHHTKPAPAAALYASPHATHARHSAWPLGGERPQADVCALTSTVSGVKRTNAASLMTARHDVDVGWWPGKQRAQQHAAAAAPASATDAESSSQHVGLPFLAPQLDVARPTLLSPADTAPYLAAPASTRSAQPLHPPEVNDGLDAQDPVRFSEALAPDTSDPLRLSAGLSTDRRKIAIACGQALRLDSIGLSDPGGHALNAGGHVYGVDFRPTPVEYTETKEYLVVSASRTANPRTMLGDAEPRPAPAALQIWSVSAGAAGAAAQELLLCHDLGTATQVSWCPAGHDHRAVGAARRLGLLAGVFSTGVIGIFAVPHPDDLKAGGATPRAVKLEPVVLLELPATAPTCLGWGGGERLAAGCMNGHLAVWAIGDVLRTGQQTALPSHYFEVHDAGILSLTWQMLPPLDFDGEPLEDDLPHVITTASLDGRIICADIDDPWMTDTKSFTRAHPHVTAWSAHLGSVLAERNIESTSFGLIGNRADTRGLFISLTAQPGRALSIATTPNHLYYARACADGGVYVSNILADVMVRRRRQRMTLPVYCLDINRSTGELLMKDQLLPRGSTAEDVITPVWHPRVAITASAWSPNVGRGLLLATGAACGLVRIDWMGHHLRFLPEDAAGPGDDVDMQDAVDAEEDEEDEEEEQEDDDDEGDD